MRTGALRRIRLLATWGRLTDIEYVYGIEFDHAGNVIEETFQGKDHEIVPFRGKREGRHPLLYVVTDNNMVKDAGTTEQRFAPAPMPFDLTDASREKVMDENPWTYAVTAREARREGRVAKAPAPGSKQIFDPRRYAAVELCTAKDDTTFATFTFAVGVSEGRGRDPLLRFNRRRSRVSNLPVSRQFPQQLLSRRGGSAPGREGRRCDGPADTRSHPAAPQGGTTACDAFRTRLPASGQQAVPDESRGPSRTQPLFLDGIGGSDSGWRTRDP